MRKYIFVWLCLLCGGCEQNEIADYQESPRVDFLYSSGSERFTDRDYLDKRLWIESRVPVQLVGPFLSQPMTFCLKLDENDPEMENEPVILEEMYTMPADTARISAVVKAERPESPGRSYSVVLAFDGKNPLHRFDVGKTEALQYRLTVEYKIEPQSWNSEYFGIYSNNKYMFMMDVFGMVFGDIPLTAESKKTVREAYDQYRKNNPPLLDDENPREEIVFPL